MLSSVLELPGRHRISWILAVLAVLVAMSVLMLHGYRDKSPTEDEWAHLTRGIAYFQGQDARLHYAHPPLANAVQGLATLGQDLPRLDETAHWARANVGQVALEFIRSDYERARGLLMQVRVVTMLFGLLLASYAFFWGLALFGPWTGLLAMCFVAFNPTIIAQARYVTTDMPAAAMLTIAIGELSRFLAGSTGKVATWLVPIWLALAVVTKHTGTLLVPIFAALLCAYFALSKGRFSTARPPWRRLLLYLVVSGCMTWLTVNAAYKFDRTFLTVGSLLETPESSQWSSSGQLLEKTTPLTAFPQWLPVPLPHVYVYGLASMRQFNRRGFPSYFMGKPQRFGHVAYFPTMLAIKNPPAMLLGLLGGALWLIRKRRRPSAAVVCVGVITLILLALMMGSHINMGIRHALPLVGTLSLLAGRGVTAFLELLSTRWAPVIAGAFIMSSAFSAITASPFYLGYFNLFAGGRARGHEISIYGEDWGQDRVYLARYVEEHNLYPLYYNHMTRTRYEEVKYLGIESRGLGCRATPPAGSYAALHALSFKTTTKDCWKWRHGLTPIAHINHHIFIWKIPEAGPSDTLR